MTDEELDQAMSAAVAAFLEPTPLPVPIVLTVATADETLTGVLHVPAEEAEVLMAYFRPLVDSGRRISPVPVGAG